MKNIPLCSSGILALFISVLAAEEVPLTPAKYEEGPIVYYRVYPDDEAFWENEPDQLTPTAVTGDFTFFFSTMYDKGLLFSLDRSEPCNEAPDVLYLDLNDNRIIDENERFGLKPVKLSHHRFECNSSITVAEKVMIRVDDEKAIPINIYVCAHRAACGNGEGIPVGTSPWSCRRGKVALANRVYDVLLEDTSINGAFDDYVKPAGFASDRLTLVQEGTTCLEKTTLRRKIDLEGRAYAVEVEADGSKLSLVPIKVEYGSVILKNPDMELTLFSEDWGHETIRSFESRSLPTGRWNVKEFDRTLGKDGFCSYLAPPGMKVEVGGEESLQLTIDTALEGTLTIVPDGDARILVLYMKTGRGAKLEALEWESVSGIPFMIMDQEGEKVLEDRFTFG